MRLSTFRRSGERIENSAASLESLGEISRYSSGSRCYPFYSHEELSVDSLRVVSKRAKGVHVQLGLLTEYRVF